MNLLGSGVRIFESIRVSITLGNKKYFLSHIEDLFFSKCDVIVYNERKIRRIVTCEKCLPHRLIPCSESAFHVSRTNNRVRNFPKSSKVKIFEKSFCFHFFFKRKRKLSHFFSVEWEKFFFFFNKTFPTSAVCCCLKFFYASSVEMESSRNFLFL